MNKMLKQKHHGLPALPQSSGKNGVDGNGGNNVYFGYIVEFFESVELTVDNFIRIAQLNGVSSFRGSYYTGLFDSSKNIQSDIIYGTVEGNTIPFYEDKNIFDYLYSDENYMQKYKFDTAEDSSTLNTLKDYIEKLGLLEYVQFTPSLARGQEYYTGTVFEVYVKDGSITSSIGGGGRYDKMITDFVNNGTTYPAVGVSFGLNVIYEILKDREEFVENALTDIYIIPMGTEIECLKIAQILRDAGYKVEVEMRNRKMKKALDYANSENIPYVCILGEDELTNNCITVRDMNLKSQTQISLENIVEEFKNNFPN